MTEEKRVTVGEVVEMLSKCNWDNVIYCNNDDEYGVKNNHIITGISQHSGGVVAINYD